MVIRRARLSAVLGGMCQLGMALPASITSACRQMEATAMDLDDFVIHLDGKWTSETRSYEPFSLFLLEGIK